LTLDLSVLFSGFHHHVMRSSAPYTLH
jgi:hypothetical protein